MRVSLLRSRKNQKQNLGVASLEYAWISPALENRKQKTDWHNQKKKRKTDWHNQKKKKKQIGIIARVLDTRVDPLY